MPDLKQSTATTRLIFMTDDDHVTGSTGLTLTITASKAGAAFASITPTVTALGDGWYSLALTTSHTDTLGDLALHVTATGADPTDKLFNVVAGSLDADVSTRASGTALTSVDSAVVALAADTADIQARIPAALVSGRMSAYVGAFDPALGTADGVDLSDDAIAAIWADAPAGTPVADIAAEVWATAPAGVPLEDIADAVVEALRATASPEPTVVPAANASVLDKLDYVFTLARNKITSTSSTITLRNNADSGNIATAGQSDDGTTYTRNEWS